MSVYADITYRLKTAVGPNIRTGLLMVFVCWACLVLGNFTNGSFGVWNAHASLTNSRLPETIRAAVLRDFPPLYLTSTASGEPVGFAVELFENLAQHIGYQVEMLVVESWEDALRELQAGNVDLIPGIAVIEERGQEFLYSAEVISMPVSFFRRSGTSDIQHVTELAGKRVGVIEKSAAEAALADQPEIMTVRMPNIETLLVALLSGDVDAVLCPENTMVAKASDIGLLKQIKVAGQPFFELKRAYQFRKEDEVLRDRFNEALARYYQTEDYLHLYQKWYDPKTFWTPDRKALLFSAIAGLIAILAALIFLRRLLRVKKAFKERDIHFRTLFETMTTGVIYQATDGRILSVNPAAENILGLSSDQIQEKTSMDPHWRMIEEDGSEVAGSEHPTMVALRTGQKIGPVVRGIFDPKRNSHIWLSITAIPLFQPDRETPFQAYATFDDITRRKQAEDALRESNAYLDNLFNHANAPIIVWDSQLRVTRFNKAFEYLTGWAETEMLGQSINRLFPPEQVEASINLIQSATTNGHHWESVEIDIQPRRGDVRTLLWNSATIVGAKDRSSTFVIAQGQDITERKQAEKQITEQVLELQRWNDVMLGREQRMIELKKEINTLSKQYGLAEKYKDIV